MNSTTIIFILFTTLALLACGVKQSDYDKLKTENEQLKKELDEYKLGADRLAALAEKAYAEKDYASAKQNILLLQSRHPESPKNRQMQGILGSIEKIEAEQRRKLEAEEKERVRRANLNNLGMWVVKNYVDKFGDSTKDRYIININRIRGTFSNTATEDSPLNVDFLISKSSDISIQLYEYARNNPVKGYSSQRYTINIKDKTGKKYALSARNYSDRLSLYEDDSRTLHRILLKGGQVSFWIKEDDTPTTQYQFVIENADWYENAYRKLTSK